MKQKVLAGCVRLTPGSIGLWGFWFFEAAGLCPSTRQAGVGDKGNSRMLCLGSGLSPAFQKTHVVVMGSGCQMWSLGVCC